MRAEHCALWRGSCGEYQLILSLGLKQRAAWTCSTQTHTLTASCRSQQRSEHECCEETCKMQPDKKVGSDPSPPALAQARTQPSTAVTRQSFPSMPGDFTAEPTGSNQQLQPTTAAPLRRVGNTQRAGALCLGRRVLTAACPRSREPCHGEGGGREGESVPGPSWSQLSYPTGSYKTPLVRLAFLLV